MSTFVHRTRIVIASRVNPATCAIAETCAYVARAEYAAPGLSAAQTTAMIDYACAAVLDMRAAKAGL